MKTLPLRGSDGVLENGGVVSPGWRSRQISTRDTPMSSSAHPVTAIDPASIVPSPAGVSKLPNGTEAAAVDGTTLRVTFTGPTALAAPVNAKVIVPVAAPAAGSDASKATDTSTAEAP